MNSFQCDFNFVLTPDLENSAFEKAFLRICSDQVQGDGSCITAYLCLVMNDLHLNKEYCGVSCSTLRANVQFPFHRICH